MHFVQYLGKTSIAEENRMLGCTQSRKLFPILLITFRVSRSPEKKELNRNPLQVVPDYHVKHDIFHYCLSFLADKRKNEAKKEI